MNKVFLVAIAFLPLSMMAENDVTVKSPDGRLEVSAGINGGHLSYNVLYDGKQMLESSPLGFMANMGDYSNGLVYETHKESTYSDNYTLNKCKVAEVNYNANTLVYSVKNAKGQKMDVEFYVSNNDIAFRYVIPRHRDTGSIRIMQEKTGFDFPNQTTTFICPQSDAMVGWKRSKPSYEEVYGYDRPVAEANAKHGYTFPCLFRVGEDGWVLIGETGNDRNYCGCRLSSVKSDGLFTVEFPMPEENNGNGTIEPAFALPGATPWRTITVGSTLKPIVETTVAWNTVKPLYKSNYDYKFGKSTWSWIVWQDASMNWNDQCAFIDLASTMGYQYILIDAGWDEQIGYDKMEELVKYAHGKNVDVFLWFSSSGYWNDIVQSPINKMDNPIARKQVMRWMNRIGVKGIKVDFWGGDKQETFRLYEDVLSDADDNGLMVIFHGCTIPRGWERMYPNYVGSEAVLASENLVFGQGSADREAKDTSTHPFIRNTLGCMEWGGSFMNRHLRRGNKGGVERKTTDCHEMAQAVLFQNPIQNFAITPENLLPETEGGAPAVSMEYMRQVPTTWTETKFIDGYPGKYCVLARKNADKWYIAGTNAEDAAKSLELDLSQFVQKGDVVTLFSDMDNREPQKSELKIKNPKKVKLNLLHNGGFVIIR